MYCIKDMQFVESHCELKFCKVLFDLRKRQLCILGMDLGQVLLGDVDVGRGVGVHGLLPALQHLLLVVGLTQLHLVDFGIIIQHNMHS